MGNLKKHIKIAKQNTVITPPLLAWLNRNDGVHVTDEKILEKVLDILKPSDGDRSGAFHPSQLYQCKRSQIFAYYNAEALSEYNPTLQNLFNDGHYRHLRWQIMLLEAGIISDVEVPVNMPEYRLTGSMDGVNEKDRWMFELKGTSRFGDITKYGVMDAHRKQVNAYLLASDLDKAIVVYECKTSQQWQEIEVHRDEETIKQIKEILEELNDSIENNIMPEVLDGCKNKEGATYNNCPYRETCFKVNRTEDIEKLSA